MSISFHLILFLLCISLQACHPKELHFVDNKFEKKLPVPNKEELAKMAFSGDKSAAECMKFLSSKEAKVRESVKLGGPKYKRGQLKRLEDVRKVSWRVPDHKKVKVKNPGFNSDYEHARTHPPSHNK